MTRERPVSAAVVIAAWARAKAPPWCALQPRDIGELMCVSREWRDEFTVAGSANAAAYVTSFVKEYAPGLAPPDGPAAPLVHAIMSGRVRLGALCSAVAAMHAACKRVRGTPYRRSLGSLVDGSLWSDESPSHHHPPLSTFSTIVVLDALVRLASRLVIQQQALAFARSRTDVRPWTLYAMFLFALREAHRISPHLAAILVMQANTALDVKWRDANRGLHYELRTLLRAARGRLRQVSHGPTSVDGA